MSDIMLTAYNGAFLGPIAKILGWLMNLIYEFLSNVLGISNISLTIILFTIIIYMFLLPITYKQQKFSKLTQTMQPELQKVQKKYKGKKDQYSIQAMQNETSEIYEKYGVSPTGSCIYLLINLPILFALLKVFQNIPAYLVGVKNQFSPLVDGIMATEGYQKIMGNLATDLKLSTMRVDFSSITDPSVLSNYIVDSLYSMNSSGWDLLKEKFSSLTDVIASTQGNINEINQFLGMNISDNPTRIITTGIQNGSYVLVVLAVLIPIISYLTQVLNMKLMPQVSNGDDAMANQMKTVNRIMPIFSLIFCFSIPIGLGVYWIISALVRSVQQFCLNKHFEKVGLDDMIKESQEKARKKREKKGISSEQIHQAAKVNARQIHEQNMSKEEKEKMLEEAEQARSHAKAGSMSEKANLVKKFNERNTK